MIQYTFVEIRQQTRFIYRTHLKFLWLIVDLRQLRAFIAVFDERSITAAARRIHLSQPALSASIKLLEDSLGTELFKRQARGVEVTDDARALYPHAQRMLADVDRLVTRFRPGGTRDTLQIGIEQDLASTLVQAFLSSARDLMPGAVLDLQVGCLGEIRLGSEESRCEDELFLPLWSDPYVVAVASTSDMRTSERAGSALSQEQANWIICPSHSSHQRLLPLYGIAADRPAARANSFRLALSLVAANIGIAIVPRSLVAENCEVRELAPLELNLERRLGLCYSAQALENPIFVELYKNCPTYLAEHADGLSNYHPARA